MTTAWSVPAPMLNGSQQRTISQIIDSLTASTAGLVPRDVIAEVVSQCRAELQPIHDDAMPEMLHCLARHRLAYLQESSAWRS